MKRALSLGEVRWSEVQKMRENAFGGSHQGHLSRQETRAGMKRLVILFATVCLLVATLGTPALATAMTNMPTTTTKLMPPNMVLDPFTVTQPTCMRTWTSIGWA